MPVQASLVTALTGFEGKYSHSAAQRAADVAAAAAEVSDMCCFYMPVQ